jgi:hypothetical protein
MKHMFIGEVIVVNGIDSSLCFYLCEATPE